MLSALTVLVVGAVAFFIGMRWGYLRAKRSSAQWLVRPHTADTLARMPLPEQGSPTVSQAAFVRTNLPGSTSTMD